MSLVGRLRGRDSAHRGGAKAPGPVCVLGLEADVSPRRAGARAPRQGWSSDQKPQNLDPPQPNRFIAGRHGSERAQHILRLWIPFRAPKRGAQRRGRVERWLNNVTERKSRRKKLEWKATKEMSFHLVWLTQVHGGPKPGFGRIKMVNNMRQIRGRPSAPEKTSRGEILF